ncbi:hypothetical protein LTR49_008072 [Elasticomyces elasticus]|nr:hypothetical protein LTR49_008072 [Elasticomyces elasticus]KAK5750836.1 hypothetical protein LTS12_019124 [Elasticomyces elasticus]
MNPVLSEKRLAHGIASDLVAYCDAHDLVAIATDAHDVVIYRITGHVAFTVKRKNAGVEVTGLAWKEDGSVLSVGWSDAECAMHLGEDGRLMATIAPEPKMVAKHTDADTDLSNIAISAFKWTRYRLSEGQSIESDVRTLGLNTGSSLDVSSDGSLLPGSSASINALARSIAIMDATSVLPKLSALPSHGLRTDLLGNRFNSQALTNHVMDSSSGVEPDQVDIMVTCSRAGSVRIQRDYLGIVRRYEDMGTPVLQASHRHSHYHSILSRTADDQLQLNTVIVPLDTISRSLFQAVSLHTKRITDIFDYTTQIMRCITHDYTTGLQFPGRLITNMQNELDEKQEGDLVTNLYHLALTGNYSETMREWLVDIVKDTNHKRWDQAVSAMYTNIQQHLFIHLKPALDRLSIATTTLRGHARYHEESTKLNFEVPIELFTRALDGIDTLRIVSQKLLLVVAEEQKQFKAFSKWLRVMIDVGAAGPGSKGAVEMEAKENPNIDYSLVLKYIEETLMTSGLARFVLEKKTDSVTTQAGQMRYELACAAVSRLDMLKSNDDDMPNLEHLIGLPALMVDFSKNLHELLQRVNLVQLKSLWTPSHVPVKVEVSPETRALDMQMIVPRGRGVRRDAGTMRLLMVAPESPKYLLLHTFPYDPDNKDAKGTARELCFTLDIVDAKFHSNDGAIVLSRNVDSIGVAYHLISEARISHTNELSAGSDLWTTEAHPGFMPERIIVGGRQDHKVCLVFGNGGRHWITLDLDSLRRSKDTRGLNGGAVVGDEMEE